MTVPVSKQQLTDVSNANQPTTCPFALGQQHQEAAQAGEEAAVAQCAKCGSTRVLFSRRQSYNESSTWCGEEEGVPVMLHCLACGAVESQRD